MRFLPARSRTDSHDDVIKQKHFPRYWPFVGGIHRPAVNSPHKGQWRGFFLKFSSVCAWINGWVNNRKAGDFRRHRAHYDVSVMLCRFFSRTLQKFLFKCQGHPVSLWRWPLTGNLETCYSLRSSFGMFNLKRRLRYLHLLTRHCACNLLPGPNPPEHEYRGKIWGYLWRHRWRHHHEK